MKYLNLFIVIILFTIFACNKNSGGSNSASNSYFFKCSVEGKNISLNGYNPTTTSEISPNGLLMSSILETDYPQNLQGSIYYYPFSVLGRYALNVLINLPGDTTLTTNNTNCQFIMNLTPDNTGDTTFKYYSIPSNFSVTVTKLSRGQGNANPFVNFATGHFTGTFYGTVDKEYSLTSGNVLLYTTNISGSFDLPLPGQ